MNASVTAPASFLAAKLAHMVLDVDAMMRGETLRVNVAATDLLPAYFKVQADLGIQLETEEYRARMLFSAMQHDANRAAAHRKVFGPKTA